MKLFSLIGLLFAGIVLIAAPRFSWSRRSEAEGNFLTLQVAPGNYINAESLVFELKSDDRPVRPLQIPEPTAKTVDGEKILIYPPGEWLWKFPAGKLSGRVDFQGCQDNGVCLLPESWSVDRAPAAESAPAAVSPAAALPEFTILRTASGYMDKDEFTGFLQNRAPASGGIFADSAWYWILLLTLAGGIALNLTPCVLPMVPVNLAIIGAAEGGKTGFWRGLCYGSGMAIAYGALGVATALAGSTFGELNSSAVFNFAIAGLFMVLALVMAGVINFNFFANIRLNPGKLNLGRSVTAFLMGAVSALLAGACVAPVVTGVLIFTVSEYQKGNFIALGLPFLLGIGMALPWPFAGLGLAVLPRPGRFMVMIKYVLAAVIALMAIYYLVLGVKLLPGKSSTMTGTSGIAAVTSALKDAESKGVPLLLFFSASWCKNCHAMERSVLVDVKPVIDRDFMLVKINAEDPSAPDIAPLLKKLNIHGFPSFAIIRAPEK